MVSGAGTNRREEQYYHEGHRERDDAMNPDDTVLDDERAKFLIVKSDLPRCADLAMHFATRCLSDDFLKRTRVNSNRVKAPLLGQCFVRLLQTAT